MLNENNDQRSVFEILNNIKKLANERNRKIAEKKDCNLCSENLKCWWHRSMTENMEFLNGKTRSNIT